MTRSFCIGACAWLFLFVGTFGTPSPTPEVYFCNFDHGLCSFTTVGDGSLDWILQSGSTPSDGTGPASDHTTTSTTGDGNYVYIESSIPNFPNFGPFLLQSVLPQGGVNSASFWYSMNGISCGSLDFEVSRDGISWESKWSKFGNQGVEWQEAFVDVSDDLVTHIRFNGSTWSDFHGDIALDDVSLQNYSTFPPTTTGVPSATPTPSFAPTPGQSPVPTSNNITTATQVLNAISEGATITLAADLALWSPIVVRETLNLTLQGGGHTVDGQNRTQCFYFTDGSFVSLLDLEITRGFNPTGNAGGIIFLSSSGLISGCVISNCVGSVGGAVQLYDAHVTIVRSVLSSNAAGKGGAFVISYQSTLNLVGSSVLLNRAYDFGGVAEVRESCIFSATSTNFTENVVTAGNGGAFYVSGGGIVELISCYLFGNQAQRASEGGGAFFASSGSVLRLNSTTVTGNAASQLNFANVTSGLCTSSGDCFRSPNYPAPYNNFDRCTMSILQGTTLQVDFFDIQDQFDTLTVGGVEYSGNQGPTGVLVSPGDEILFEADGTTTLPGFEICSTYRSDGGGLYVSGAHVDLHDSIITGNSASRGGGMFVSLVSSVTSSGSVVSKNIAYQGSAMYIDESIVNLYEVEVSQESDDFDTIYVESGELFASGLIFDGRFAGPFAATGAVCMSHCLPGYFGNCSAADGAPLCFKDCGSCPPCDAGTYSTLSGSVTKDDCAKCPGGSVSLSGAQGCETCPPGRYASSDPNEAGGGQLSQVLSGATTCNACPADTFTAVPLTIVCRVCDSGFSSKPESTSCTLCQAGYYRSPSGGCLLCPRNAACQIDPGENVFAPALGFWIDASTIADIQDPLPEIHHCFRATCTGSSPALSSCWDPAVIATCDADSLLCSEGSSGPLCGSCGPGFAYSSSSNGCERCSDSWATSGLHLSAAALSIAVVFLVWKYRAALQLENSWIFGIMSAVDTAKIRIIYSTLQIILGVSWNLDVDFPSPFSHMSSVLSSLVSLEIIPFQCVLGGSQATLASVVALSAVPFALAGVIFAVFLLRCAVARKQGRSCKIMIRQIVSQLLILSYVVLPPVARRQYQALDCISIDGKRYLRSDTSIRCEGSEYNKFVVFDAMLIAAFLSLPCIWLSLLWRQRKYLGDSSTLKGKAARNQTDSLVEQNFDLEKIQFLWEPYRNSWYFFEPFDMLRRIVMTCVVPLISPKSSRRAAFGLLLALLSSIFIREAEPYANTSNNILAYAAHYSIAVTFGAALIITTDVSKNLNPAVLGVILVAVTFVVPVMVLYTGVRHHAEARSRRMAALDTQDLLILSEVMRRGEPGKDYISESDPVLGGGVELVQLEVLPEPTSLNRTLARDIISRVTIPASSVTLEKKLGAGAFGDVWLGRYSGVQCAVKTMKVVNEATTQNFRSEIILTAALQHPNIVKFIGACWGRELVGLVLEFVGGGALDQLLGSHEGLYWEDPLLRLASDIARGMAYLHSCQYYDEEAGESKLGVVHRDLKPANVLVTPHGTGKISDFGTSRAFGVGESSSLETAVGTPIFCAPEIMRGEHYSIKCDVYSFGFVLLDMLFELELIETLKKFWLCEINFENAQKEKTPGKKSKVGFAKVLNSVIHNDWRPISADSSVPTIPQSIQALVVKCYASDADSRPSFEEVLKELAGPCASEIESRSYPRPSLTSDAELGFPEIERSGVHVAVDYPSEMFQKTRRVSENPMLRQSTQAPGPTTEITEV